LSPPEALKIGPLARHDGGPAFEEAWQAELLALAHALADNGMFAPAAWSEALGAELQRASARGEPDDQATYYRAALAALERLIERDGRITAEALAHRTEQWRCAYLNTRHGRFVELPAGAANASGQLPL
jgi:nitrile hydratase accessory protein